MQQANAVYFDGQSNRKRKVQVRIGEALDIVEGYGVIASWPRGDVRRVEGASGSFRLMCVSAPGLARLEIHDDATKQAIEAQCPALNANTNSRQTLKIIAYSAAALASFAALLIYGVPLLADSLAQAIPMSVERRLGETVDGQVRFMFGGKLCEGVAGRAALARLTGHLQGAVPLSEAFEVQVLSTAVPNAFALPGGKVYVTEALLQKAQHADELAGVIAHELGHLANRDNLRVLIQEGGTGFLVGLLFGDVVGGTAILFAARSLLTTSYSRDAERGADAFARDAMLKLGRSPKPMGELLVRITGTESNTAISLLTSHPLTQERLAAMTQADRPATGAELLTAAEWSALKGICL